MATIIGTLAVGMEEAEFVPGHPGLEPADIRRALGCGVAAISERHLALAVAHG